MHHFYSTQISQSEVILSADQAHHARRVLRLNPGVEVKVFNGKGSVFHCRIIELTKNEALLSIIKEVKAGFKQSALTLLIAPTKSIDRFEWFLEKATEIGVNTIIPILTEHSERKIIKPDRLEKVIVSAMKQSMNPYKPTLHPLRLYSDEIINYTSSDRFISYCLDDKKSTLFDSVRKGHPTSVLIGPEGDFSPEEIKMAISNGWKPVTLGHQRFRTETAGVLAVHSFDLKTRNAD